MNNEWLKLLPVNSILTPHPKVFERISEKTTNGYNRHLLQLELSIKYNIIIVLKGAYTSITSPDGNCVFNSTGNSGMATAGSGDVLTGIILSFLAQGYSPRNAAIMGTFYHGAAGDIAASQLGQISMTSGNIIDYLYQAFPKKNLPIYNV